MEVIDSSLLMRNSFDEHLQVSICVLFRLRLAFPAVVSDESTNFLLSGSANPFAFSGKLRLSAGSASPVSIVLSGQRFVGGLDGFCQLVQELRRPRAVHHPMVR